MAISNAKRTGPLQEAAITEFTAAKKISARGCNFSKLSHQASTLTLFIPIDEVDALPGPTTG
jgi:hypothetical protein